jgi:hypothetical protein
LRGNLAKLGLLAAISGNFDNAGKVRDELANASRSSKPTHTTSGLRASASAGGILAGAYLAELIA